MKYLFPLLFLLAQIPVFGQKIYVSRIGEVHVVDVTTFQDTLLCLLDDLSLELNDIALDPNGVLYGVETTKLYKIDPATGVTTLVHDFVPDVFVGLVSDANGKLYLAGEKLVVFDPATGMVQNPGKPPQVCAGDLTFWNGDLYMTAFDSKVYKIDVQNAAQSTVYMTLNAAPVGFVTIWDCITGKTRTFGFGTGTLEIDMAGKTFQTATDNFISASGATSPWEWLGDLNPGPAIDTILLHHPDCGMTNGIIEFVPSAAGQGMLEFSLDGQAWQSSGLFAPLPGGVYVVHVRGGTCVNAQTSIVLDENNTLPISATPIAPDICNTAVGMALLHPAGNAAGYTYSVDNGAVQTDTLFAALTRGYHSFQAIDANGCKSFTYTIIQDSSTAFIAPVTTMPDLTRICAGAVVTLTTSGPPNAVFTWYEDNRLLPGETGPVLILSDTIPVGVYHYRATLVDSFGCTASMAAPNIVVVDCTRLPTAFTPNGDGVNDVFRQIGANPGKIFTLAVYNRWGQRLYEETSSAPQWNGLVDGTPAPAEVYVFTISSGGKILQSGGVTLLR
ncbi:MAG TPA: gliding motility-associated C-terminal domain-containing protein [Saprospiraceae bacterium]|nr:gliding motility-associated C-terminal domain-containing protein [Saprospiraceae bacterium]HPI07249.1 gliding motility-associated C-terminal domain-containing protein [Saprospiraceae bacterium]